MTSNEIGFEPVRFTQARPVTTSSRPGSAFSLREVEVGHLPRASIVVVDDELIGDLTIAAARALVIGGEIAPLKIFSVGFFAEDMAKLTPLRAKFLTFGKGSLDLLGLPDTGAAQTLLDFLDEWVLPRSAARPSLLGYSLSGTFALQAVSRSSGKFSNVAAISPSLWAEPQAGITVEQALEIDTQMLCHLAAGTSETDKAQTGQKLHMFEEVESLAMRLRDRFGERVSTTLHHDETHFGVPFSAVCRSLREMFR